MPRMWIKLSPVIRRRVGSPEKQLRRRRTDVASHLANDAVTGACGDDDNDGEYVYGEEEEDEENAASDDENSINDS